MIDPQLIFQKPEDYLEILTGQNTEGQYFDRKAVGDKLVKTRDGIKECISAFTNSRGGIIAVGIHDNGEIQGLDTLSESEYNSLVEVRDVLINHATQTQEHTLGGKKVLFFFCPEGLSGICETKEKTPAAWIRHGKACLPLTSGERETLILQRNKKWEQLTPCDFDPSLLNISVVEIFKKRFLEESSATFEKDDQSFLQNIGAIKMEGGRLVFTNAGFVFFANNPASLIPSVQVRLLRYDCESTDWQTPGTPNFDKTYDGCLPELLRKIRVFINEGAFFKTYTYRNSYQSGLIDEPEFPPNAVEETIVNALVHRDYNSSQAILCILYKDAFVVRSPGKLLQPDGAFVPTKFNLGEQALIHHARNPKIMQWARTMVDENGQRFVKQLSEGHQTMLRSMLDLKLPAPQFATNGFTTVTLFNNYQQREERQRRLTNTLSHEFSNLFPIEISFQMVAEGGHDLFLIKQQIENLFKDKLTNSGWFIDHTRAGRVVAHQKGQDIPLDNRVNEFLKIFPAYSFQFHLIENSLYLSVDFDIQLVNIARVERLIQLGISDLRHRPAQVRFKGTWTTGIIEDCNEHYTRVQLPEFERVEDILSQEVIPSLGMTLIKELLKKANVSFDLPKKIKELSLANRTNSARERADKILGIAKTIAQTIFPLAYNGYQATLGSNPTALHPAEENNVTQSFNLFHLSEPRVRFANNQTESQISRGLTQFGTFGEQRKNLEIIPFCISGQEGNMQNLLKILQTGSMNFKGMERTFGIRPSYTAIISKPRAEDYLAECERLLREHPDWEGDAALSRVFLIHIPEEQYSIFDWQTPYFQLKEYLLAKGIPVQMLDTETLRDPKFKDLNLSLNIMAKTGGIPWVLPNALPDADVFIGLSYTQFKNNEQLYRTLGYANVFNQYGQWQFYKGNNKAFNYDEKHLHLSKLVEDTLRSLPNLPENPHIHLHYSAKFNRRDRDVIVETVLKIRKNARVSFVWINTGHNIRLFDRRTEGNGSLVRGAFVPMGKGRFYLSTTGYTTVAKTLGTPIMLEANVRTLPEQPGSELNPGTVARHLLHLTKLNWASSQSISGEPVTIKYARDIARLSHAFLQRRGGFVLHPVLEKTPWFI